MIKTHIPARPRNKKIVPTGGASISPSISSAVGSSHTHNNKSLLDLINQGNIDVLSKLFVDESDNLYTTQNFYSQQGASAYGIGSGGSGGGGDISKLPSWAGYTPAMVDYYVSAGLLVPFYNDMQSRVGAIEAGGGGGGSTVTWGTESGGYVPLTVEGVSKSVALTTHNHSGVYEPVFSKNTAFNKAFGTTSGTVAQGNDSRIENGQTAYSWGNHASAGYALNTALTAHINKVDNPHSVTKTQVGLSNVLNVASYSKTESDASITNAISAIEIGGRNLLLNSKTFNEGSGSTGITSSITEEGYLSVVAEVGNGNWFTGFMPSGYGALLNGGILSQNDLITVSMEVKSPNSTTPPSLYLKGDYNYIGFEGNLSDNFSKVSFTTTWQEAGYTNFHLGFSGLSGTYIFKNIKLEKGNKATDWTPAPEDQVSDWSTTDVTSFSYIKNKPTTLSGYGITDAVTTNTTQTITGAKTFSVNLTASTSVTTPKVIFAAAGWSLEQVGTELQMKHNGTAKMRFLSGGAIVATGEVTAFVAAT